MEEYLFFFFQQDAEPDKQSSNEQCDKVIPSTFKQLEVSSLEGLCSRQNIDIAEAVKVKSLNKLNTEVISHMLNNLYVPDSQSKMPSSEHSKHGTRHILLKHLTDFPWLAVSQILRGAFCTACVLFSKEGVGKTGGQSTGKLVKTLLTQFKNLLGKNGDLTKHASCHFHIEAMKDMVSFKKRMTSGPLSTDIDKQLITARLEEAKHNRSILVPIIDTILTCGRQNIALRGNREEGAVDSKGIEPKSNDGNFRSLLRYRIRGGDKELIRHCEMHSKKNNIYEWTYPK